MHCISPCHVHQMMLYQVHFGSRWHLEAPVSIQVGLCQGNLQTSQLSQPVSGGAHTQDCSLIPQLPHPTCACSVSKGTCCSSTVLYRCRTPPERRSGRAAASSRPGYGEPSSCGGSIGLLGFGWNNTQSCGRTSPCRCVWCSGSVRPTGTSGYSVCTYSVLRVLHATRGFNLALRWTLPQTLSSMHPGTSCTYKGKQGRPNERHHQFIS